MCSPPMVDCDQWRFMKDLLLQEIKEEAEKRRRSDEGAASLTLSVAAPYVTRVAAELTYDYKDR